MKLLKSNDIHVGALQQRFNWRYLSFRYGRWIYRTNYICDICSREWEWV